MTIKLKWPRYADGRRAKLSEPLPEEFCHRVIGHLADGNLVDVTDSPSRYNGNGTSELLGAVLRQYPFLFRERVAAGLTRRAMEIADKDGETPTARAYLKQASELRFGEGYIHIPVGEHDSFLVPPRSEERGMYGNPKKRK